MLHAACLITVCRAIMGSASCTLSPATASTPAAASSAALAVGSPASRLSNSALISMSWAQVRLTCEVRARGVVRGAWDSLLGWRTWSMSLGRCIGDMERSVRGGPPGVRVLWCEEGWHILTCSCRCMPAACCRSYLKPCQPGLTPWRGHRRACCSPASSPATHRPRLRPALQWPCRQPHTQAGLAGTRGQQRAGGVQALAAIMRPARLPALLVRQGLHDLCSALWWLLWLCRREQACGCAACHDSVQTDGVQEKRVRSVEGFRV